MRDSDSALDWRVGSGRSGPQTATATACGRWSAWVVLLSPGFARGWCDAPPLTGVRQMTGTPEPEKGVDLSPRDRHLKVVVLQGAG